MNNKNKETNMISITNTKILILPHSKEKPNVKDFYSSNKKTYKHWIWTRLFR